MRSALTGRLQTMQRAFASFTIGQKTVAVVGGLALLLAAGMLFRWAATPSYAPLFTDVAPADAAAIVDQLESAGTPYQLKNGGGTILVPRADVYDSRIRLSAEGLPSAGSQGYAILDQQDLSTSQFQEQTGYKRALEGELKRTIEALDPVETAVVHIALPQEELFADEQDATTASVLVSTRPGQSLDAGQVQAVVHLIASSVEGLDPKQVTVADATGKVLSAAGEGFDTMADSRAQQVVAFEDRMTDSVQGVLDRVLGPGNTAVQVTADLDFDKTVTSTTRYFSDPELLPLSSTTAIERYSSPDGTEDAGAGGVVGPDGQLDGDADGAAGASSYVNKEETVDNAVGQTIEQREAAPGSVSSLHVGIVVDSGAAGGVSTAQVSSLVSSALGIDRKRGDTVEVSVMPFDRTAEEAAAAALAEAKEAEQRAELIALAKTLGVALLVAGLLFAAWRGSRKRQQARQQATSYVVEQLRREAAERTQALPAPAAALEAVPAATPAAAALELSEKNARDEIAALVERQPEEVAQLLRGWLTDPGDAK